MHTFWLPFVFVHDHLFFRIYILGCKADLGGYPALRNVEQMIRQVEMFRRRVGPPLDAYKLLMDSNSMEFLQEVRRLQDKC